MNPVTEKLIYSYVYTACIKAGTLANLNERQKNGWQEYSKWLIEAQVKLGKMPEERRIKYCNATAKNKATDAAHRNWKMVDPIKIDKNGNEVNILDLMKSPEEVEPHDIKLPTLKSMIANRSKKGRVKPSELFRIKSKADEFANIGTRFSAEVTLFTWAILDLVEKGADPFRLAVDLILVVGTAGVPRYENITAWIKDHPEHSPKAVRKSYKELCDKGKQLAKLAAKGW